MSQDVDLMINFFKALANEERLSIIKLLKKNKEMFAQNVENEFFLEQSTTSHHLNTLKRAGIAKSRKEGRKVFYSIDYEKFKQNWDIFSALLLD